MNEREKDIQILCSIILEMEAEENVNSIYYNCPLCYKQQMENMGMKNINNHYNYCGYLIAKDLATNFNL